ncbi:hypothetical protein RB601_000133 [Gaeumannomyces tritici]
MMKGRPRVPTGGSVKGTTVMWGDYGLRMKDHDRRISAQQLKRAEDAIKNRMRGQKYRLYKRLCCNIGVFTSGNEHRMGKGKGSFDHWAARVAVSQVIFEIRGLVHEQVIKDAFRLAGNKLPGRYLHRHTHCPRKPHQMGLPWLTQNGPSGQYEFVTKNDVAVVGITKLDGVTLEDLKNPRKVLPIPEVPPQSPTVTASAPS